MSVIDAQSHWYPREFFDAHVDRPSYPRTKRTRSGYVFEISPHRILEISSEFFDLQNQLDQMEMDGVSTIISSSGSLGVDLLPINEAREIARLVNEERAKAQKDYPGRFFGLATIPMQDPAAALDELEYALSRLELRGVCIGSNVNGLSLAAPELSPIYKRLEELKKPLFLHPTNTSMQARLRLYGLELTLGFVFDTTIAVVELVLAGVVPSLPDLQIVHPHLGGTIPFLAARIDHEYKRIMNGTLEKLPSEYLRNFYTDMVVSQSPGALRLGTEFYGVERIMFGSDYPYWSQREGIEIVEANFEGAGRAAVLGGNAGRLLKLSDAPSGDDVEAG